MPLNSIPLFGTPVLRSAKRQVTLECSDRRFVFRFMYQARRDVVSDVLEDASTDFAADAAERQRPRSKSIAPRMSEDRVVYIDQGAPYVSNSSIASRAPVASPRRCLSMPLDAASDYTAPHDVASYELAVDDVDGDDDTAPVRESSVFLAPVEVALVDVLIRRQVLSKTRRRHDRVARAEAQLHRIAASVHELVEITRIVQHRRASGTTNACRMHLCWQVADKFVYQMPLLSTMASTRRASLSIFGKQRQHCLDRRPVTRLGRLLRSPMPDPGRRNRYPTNTRHWSTTPDVHTRNKTTLRSFHSAQADRGQMAKTASCRLRAAKANVAGHSATHYAIALVPPSCGRGTECGSPFADGELGVGDTARFAGLGVL